MSEKPQIIILNGTSSAGKSTIAKELQKTLEGPFLHFQMDMFWDMVPEQPDGELKTFPNIETVMIEAAKALLRCDCRLIFDTVTMGNENIERLRQNFKSFDPFIVGVKASLETVNQREKSRGDRRIGMAASQFDAIHQDVVYDFEVDTTSVSASESANLVLKALKSYHLRKY